MVRDLVLLLLLAASAVTLMIHGRQLQPKADSHIAGLNGNAGVQMEFAKNSTDVSGLLGEAGLDNPNWAIMRQQQYLDFPFIVLYWAVFFYTIGGPLRNSTASAGHTLGYLLGLFITIAALADFLEDGGILAALSSSHQGLLWPFPFGVTKWLFVFLSLGLSGCFLVSYPKLGVFAFPASTLTTALVRITGAFFLAAGLTGLIGAVGAIFQKGPLVLLGGLLSFIGSIFLIVAVALGLVASSHRGQSSTDSETHAASGHL